MRVTSRAPFVAVAAALAIAPVAAAQPPASDAGEARQAFTDGLAALDAGRFAEARDLLRRSLELYPSPSAAFNLALALRGTGEALSAVRTLDALLAGEHGEIGDAERAQAGALRDEVRAQVATLTVEISGGAGAEARLDGEALGPEPGGVWSLEVDPGAHVVTARAPGFETAERRVRVGRGATERVSIGLVRSSRALVSTGDEDRSIFESGWLWAGAGVVVAAAIAGTVLVLSGDGFDTYSDDVFGNTVTLSRPP